MDLIKGKISVLIPIKNNHEFLKSSLESIQNQSYNDWEIILIDDESEPKIDFSNIHINVNKVRLIRIEKSKGISTALNTGLELCDGEFIARFDSDDICLTDRFESQIKYMQNNKSVGVLGGSAIAFSESEKYRIVQKYIGDDLGKYLVHLNFLIHPTVMIRNEILKNNDLRYDENLTNAEDYDLWIRLSQYTKIANLPKEAIHYRIHDKSQTINRKSDQLHFSIEIQKKFLKEKIKTLLTDGSILIYGLAYLTRKTLYKQSYKYPWVRFFFNFKNKIFKKLNKCEKV